MREDINYLLRNYGIPLVGYKHTFFKPGSLCPQCNILREGLICACQNCRYPIVLNFLSKARSIGYALARQRLGLPNE